MEVIIVMIIIMEAVTVVVIGSSHGQYSHHSGKSNQDSITIQVPNDSVGLIIGKGMLQTFISIMPLILHLLK